MTIHLSTVVELAMTGVAAGWLGAVVGIGGGVVIVPALVLAFGYPTTVAVAVSLVAVAANSVAAGGRYASSGLAHKRLALTLEIATTLGGLTGGVVAGLLSASVLNGVFAAVAVLTSVLVVRGRGEEGEVPAGDGGGVERGKGRRPQVPPDSEVPGALAGAYVAPDGTAVSYSPRRLPLGGGLSYVAGLASGLLGVGGGFLKVPAMSVGMDVPLRVAAATSNFMIGVTASSSLLVYLVRGDVRPYLAAPVACGVMAGALGGSWSAGRFSVRFLQRLLATVMLTVAGLMSAKAGGLLR